MPYQLKLISRLERDTKIRAALAAPKGEEDFYDFRNQKTKLKVVRIDLGLPIYRVENFRTYTDQKEHIIREGKPADFFQTGQENESVQQIQHEILAKLAGTGRADSITPVIDVLKKEGQREAILITHAGVVVNGNRRLAGMRELYAEDAVANAHFSHVDCMVLPSDATPVEIVDIEAALQAKRETKLNYDWIGDCALIKMLISMGRTATQVADRLNRKEKEIKNSLLALTEADLYLSEWAKAEGEYGRVRDDGEQFFKDLPGQLNGKDRSLQEGSRVIAWTLFDSRKQLGERIYSFNITFGKRAADVLDRLASDLGVPLESAQPSAPIEGEFDVALDEEGGAISYESVIEALIDPERREEATEALIEVCRGVIESERDKKSGTAAEKAIIVAHSKLAEVDLSKAAPTTYATLDRQLDAIVAKATELKAKLAKYQSDAVQTKSG